MIFPIRTLLVVATTLASSFYLSVANEPRTAAPFHAARCEGTYPGHLQGVCTNDRDAIFWSFTTVLVKTDADGRVLKKADVANHHGDLCFHDDRLYVAVNLGLFNLPAGRADSWVYVYDADSLDELARHKTLEVVHGAGGIGFQGGRFFVVGGLPPGIEENYVYEYDPSFAFKKKHVLTSGYTLLGIQTAAFAGDRWWFGCYGNPRVLLTADKSLTPIGRFEVDASLGIVGTPDGKLLVASGSREADKRYSGRLEVGVPDKRRGLRIVEPLASD